MDPATPTTTEPADVSDLKPTPEADRKLDGGSQIQPADPLTVADGSAEAPSPAKPSSKIGTPSKNVAGPNGTAKAGIAAAIAAFEKGAIDKAAKQPAAGVRRAANPAPNHSLKASTSAKNPNISKTATATMTVPAAKKAPSPPLKKAEPVSSDPTTAPVAKAQLTTTRTGVVAPSAKSGLRLSVSNRTSTSGPAGKPGVRDNAVAGASARIMSPPVGTTAGTAPRRTTLATTATKAPIKATAPAPAAARKLSAHPTNAPAVRAANTAATVALKRASVGPMGAPRTTGNAGGQQAATAELESKLSQANSSLAEKSELLVALEGKLEEVSKNAAATEEKLTAEIENLTDKLQGTTSASHAEVSDTAAALQTAQVNLASAQAQIAELQEKIESNQKDHTTLTGKQAESSAQVSQLEQSLSALKKELEEAVSSKDAAVAELVAQHSRELESKSSEIRQTFEEEKRTLESRLQQAEARSKEIEDDSAAKLEATLEEEQIKKMEAVSKKHTEELEALVSMHSSKIEALTCDHEAAFKTLRETLEEELAGAREKLAASEAAVASTASDLKEQHATELAAAVTQTKSEAKEAHEANIASLKEEHASALAKLEASVSEIKQTQAKLEEERDNLKCEIETLKTEKLGLEERLSKELEGLKTEHAGKLEQEYQRAKDELSEAHIEQLRTLRQTSQETIDQLVTSHQAELEAAKATLESDFTSEKAGLANELSEVKLELSALHSDLSATRGTFQDQRESIARLTTELGAARSALADAETKSKELVQPAELERLEKALREAQEEAIEGKAVLVNAQKDLVAEFDHARERHESETKQHIEEKTLLQQEVSRLKQKMESDADKMEMNQSLVDELGRSVEHEMANREEAEKRLKALEAQISGKGSSEDQKLAELHEAHNAKITELLAEVEKWKDHALKAQETAEEMDFKYKLMERLMAKDQKNPDGEDDDYENQTSVEKSSPIEAAHDAKKGEETRPLVEPAAAQT